MIEECQKTPKGRMDRTGASSTLCKVDRSQSTPVSWGTDTAAFAPVEARTRDRRPLVMRGSSGIMPGACLRPRLLGHKKSRDFRAFRESPYLRIPNFVARQRDGIAARAGLIIFFMKHFLLGLYCNRKHTRLIIQ